MASLIGSLYTGASGLYTNQAGVDVTGNNISNVNTEGYSREIVSITSATPVAQKGLLLGTGSTVDTVYRAENTFITEQLIAASSNYGEYEAAGQPLSEIEQILDIDETSLSSDIDAFFDAWEVLSLNPGEATERQQVIAEAEDLADKFQQISQSLSDVVESVNVAIESEIDSLNAMLEQLATLNSTIREADTKGTNANTLEDQRDLLVQQISETCGASSYIDDNKMVCLQLENGLPLAAGTVASSFTTERVAGRVELTLNVGQSSYGLASDDVDGTFKGLLQVRDEVIPELEDDIDRIAYEVATAVNGLQTSGLDGDGNAGTELFGLTPPTDPAADPWQGAASSIVVNYSDPSLVVAGTSGLSGDNSVCLEVVSLYNSESIDGSTYSEEYARIAARVGLLVSANEDHLLASLDNLEETLQNRDEVSGVSTDEEMLLLIQYQTGYEAAASYLTVVKEMLDVMLAL